MTTIYTTTTAPLATHEHDRVITATFRQPARSVHVIIDWSLVSDSLADVPSQYRPLVEAVMLTAAKDILSDYIKGYSVGVAPAEVDAGMFSYPAILDRAANAGIQWMSKEEITEQWKASATYQAWITDSRFKTMPKFAKAVNYYGDLIIKLAGKTSSYKDTDLDLMLAKLQADDYSTPLGQFMVRRVEALKAKPTTDEVDVDML